jgi:exosome complex RNA-binding protein Csl4
MRTIKKTLSIVLALAFFALAGCEEVGRMGGLGDYGTNGNDVIGEVMNVDTRGRQIDIRADSGRMRTIGYDNNTQVIYRQRNYSVANLERGDYVAVRVQQDRDGRYYADTVTVRESAQDRGTIGGGRLDRTEGRVEYVDSRRGTFEIRDSRNRLIVVSVPFNAPRSVTDRFNRLRNGDYVRIEGRSVSADRFDLENFS